MNQNRFYIPRVARYWSLPVEFQFYVMLPVFVLVLSRNGAVALIAVAFLLYGVSGYTNAQFITFQLAWQFIGGVLAGGDIRRTQVRREIEKVGVWLITGALHDGDPGGGKWRTPRAAG